MSYKHFAQAYDVFMDDIPYQVWFDFMHKKMMKYRIHNGLVLDLGCGTGKMTEMFASAGYDMIGVDLSTEMLEIALEKKQISGSDILYLNQDMTEFELYGSVRVIYSVCDSINYLLTKEDLANVFKKVEFYLDPGGIFLFDCKTPYYYQEILGDNTIAENREDFSFIWENEYDEKERISDSELTIFIRDMEKEDEKRSIQHTYSQTNERFIRFQEQHSQRGYSIEEIKEVIQETNLELVGLYDNYTEEDPSLVSERVVYIIKNKIIENEMSFYNSSKILGNTYQRTMRCIWNKTKIISSAPLQPILKSVSLPSAQRTLWKKQENDTIHPLSQLLP